MSKRITGESLTKDTGQRAREGKESLQAIMHIWHLWIESVKAGEVGRKNFNMHFIAVLRVSSRPMGSQRLSNSCPTLGRNYVAQVPQPSQTLDANRWEEASLSRMSWWIWGSLVSTMLLMPGFLEGLLSNAPQSCNGLWLEFIHIFFETSGYIEISS